MFIAKSTAKIIANFQAREILLRVVNLFQPGVVNFSIFSTGVIDKMVLRKY